MVLKLNKPFVVSALLLTALVVLAGYGYKMMGTVNKRVASDRWYSQEQVEHGDTLYQANCASCHKPDASGTTDWKKVDAQGKYPPPPLNGTAHAWHHPLSTLRKTIIEGGVPLGGSMPGFGGQFSDEQIEEILAWIQSHWSDETYSRWSDLNAARI